MPGTVIRLGRLVQIVEHVDHDRRMTQRRHQFRDHCVDVGYLGANEAGALGQEEHARKQLDAVVLQIGRPAI